MQLLGAFVDDSLGRSSVQLRARVWPVLLGVDALPFDEAAYQAQQGTRHRDSSTVECDVERSLWSYTEGAALLPVILPAV